jgi:hypothetical protein
MFWIAPVLFFLLYEFLVRNIPTTRNLSLIDLLKRLADKISPNYHKDDFPMKKH